jgi:hypothetical protein
LAVDGSIKVVGRVPSVDALNDLLAAMSAFHTGADARRFQKGRPHDLTDSRCKSPFAWAAFSAAGRASRLVV